MLIKIVLSVLFILLLVDIFKTDIKNLNNPVVRPDSIQQLDYLNSHGYECNRTNGVIECSGGLG
jgi:hypothetical protein